MNAEQQKAAGEFVRSHGFRFATIYRGIAVEIPFNTADGQCGVEWHPCYSVADVRAALGY